MGLIPFQPAQRASGAPEYREFDIQASATFTHGSPMQRDATPSDIEEHDGGAVVTGIIGVSLFGVDSGVPSAKGSTAYGTTVIVGIANADQLFLGQLSASSAVVTPTSADKRTYGMIKVVDDWYVDQDDTTDVVLQVITTYPNIKAVLFKFLTASISP